MKINAVNTIKYMSSPLKPNRTAVPYPEYTYKKNISFGHTAVPYPEYEQAYHNRRNAGTVSKIAEKISALFTPEVTQKSEEIKNDINRIYEENKNYRGGHQLIIAV